MDAKLFLVVFFATVTLGLGYSQEFDFIIVGGGTGGCAVASRLSENGRYSVLVIHDGLIAPPILDVPALAVQVFFDPAFAIFFEGAQNQNLPFKRTIDYIVGRSLGGGSTINGMFFNRGSPKDYDNWANITGDYSWKYENMLKYFKKVETYRGDFPSDQHGDHGPITVSRPKFAPQLEQWLSAGRELGYPIADPNGPQKISFGPVEFAKRFGRRVSAYTGYIKPHVGRPNLKIVLSAEANRIVFQGKKAIGVVYTEKVNGTSVGKKFVIARKEIIVSCGVMGSPVLLMKSGIGPKEMLEAAGIPPVAYLPVGQTLKDHVFINLAIVMNKSLVFDAARDLTPQSLEFYNKFGDGPYSSYGGCYAQSFTATSFAAREGHGDWPDLHIFMEIDSFASLDDFDGDFELGNNEAISSTSMFLVRPKSRGWLRLNVTDIDSPPEISFQYFEDPKDMQMFLEGIKFTLKMYEETQAWRDVGARYPTAPLKVCGHLPFRSDEYWRCHVINQCESGLHAGGTCRMGYGPQDKDAVVDSNLKVIGIEGLRVVDASIMPQPTNANTHAVVYGIAVKTSDAILQEWERKIPNGSGAHGYSSSNYKSVP